MTDGSTAEPAEATPPEPVDVAVQAVPSRPSSLGIWAFVMALLGLVGLLPVIGSALGFVLGRVALRRSDVGPMRGGRGLAVAAVSISVVTLVVIALAAAAYALTLAYLEI